MNPNDRGSTDAPPDQKATPDIRGRLSRDQFIIADTHRLLQYIENSADRESIRRIAQRAICEQGGA